MTSLDKIRIEGFKSIRKAEIELRPLNVLIGANGAGKSNFVGIFKLLYELINQNLQIYVSKTGGVNDLLYFGQQQTEELHLFLEFGQNAYRCRLQPTARGNLVFVQETIYFHNRQEYLTPYTKNLGAGHLETHLLDAAKSIDGGIARHILQAVQSWQLYHFHDTSDSARIKNDCPIHDNRYLRPDASNLAAYLYLLRQAQEAYYENIVSVIQLVAPFFSDFYLRPSPLNPERIRLEWQEKGSDMYFNAHSLSDGTLRFISLAVLLLQPPEQMPKTILLDEPELGLHPYAIVILAELLRSAASHTQIVVSTQSVTLVNQFAPEDLIIVERSENQSTFRHLDEVDIDFWLEDYSLGELWEKNVLGGRPSL